MTSPQLLANIKASESCKLVAYKDTNGFWTIGWGHKLEAGIDWEGQEWTQETADHQLQADIDEATEQAQNLPEWPLLNACRQDTLIELVFNMGLGTWHKFGRCRAAIAAGDWVTAADQLLNSDWKREVGPTRSGRLAKQLLKGTYG